MKLWAVLIINVGSNQEELYICKCAKREEIIDKLDEKFPTKMYRLVECYIVKEFLN